jgi:O-antigen ligase
MVIGAGVAVALLVANPAIPPLWAVLGLLVFVAIIEGLLRYPAVMLVPVIFIPQWKDLSFFKSLQSSVDLTLVSLIILCVVLIFNTIAFLARGGTIKELFAGQGKGILAFFAFAGIVALSYFYTPAPNWGFTQATRLCGIGGLLFLSPFVLIRTEKDFRQFAFAFVFFAMALAAEIIFMPRYAVDQWGQAYAVKTDIGGGWIIGMAILLLLYYPFGATASSKWFWRLFCGPILIVGLVAATARGPLVGLLLVFVLTPLVLPRKSGASSKALTSIGILVALVVAGAVATSLLPDVGGKYREKTEEVERVLHGSWPGGTMGERLDFYQAAIEEIPEHPVLGLGVGGWSAFYYGHDTKSYPHNLFLLVGVEEGLVGLIALCAFLWVVGSAIKRVLAMARERFVVLFSLVVFCVTVSMFSGDLDTNRLLWLWCGMALSFERILRFGAVMSQPSRAWEPSEEYSPAFLTARAGRAYRSAMNNLPWA